MLKARRSTDDIQNNVWVLTDEPEIDAPKGERAKPIFGPVTLPWSVETEEQATAAILEIKDYFAAEAAKAAAEAKPKAKGRAVEKAPTGAVVYTKFNAVIAEGAKALRDQLGDKADEIVAHEPQDTTLLRVLADVVTKAGPAIREQGLNRAALVAKLQERLPPKN